MVVVVVFPCTKPDDESETDVKENCEGIGFFHVIAIVDDAC